MRFRAYHTHDPPRELEGGRRRVQRGLPRAGHAPADPPVDRRRRASPTSSSSAHARYGRLAGARRELRPSPRLGLARTTTTKARSSPRSSPGLGGAFLGEERAAVDELRARGPPAGATLLAAYQARRSELLAARGFDVAGFARRAHDERRRRLLVPERRRPDLPGQRDPLPRPAQRLDPDSRDPRHLGARVAAPRCASGTCRSATFYADWHDRDWGEITDQDYDEHAEVQTGMKSRGFDGSPAQPAPGGQRAAHAPRDRPLPDEVKHGEILRSRSPIGVV